MLGTEESLFLSVSQSGRGEHYLSDDTQSIVQFGRGWLKLLGCFSESSVEDYGTKNSQESSVQTSTKHGQ